MKIPHPYFRAGDELQRSMNHALLHASPTELFCLTFLSLLSFPNFFFLSFKGHSADMPFLRRKIANLCAYTQKCMTKILLMHLPWVSFQTRPRIYPSPFTLSACRKAQEPLGNEIPYDDKVSGRHSNKRWAPLLTRTTR